MKKSHRHDQLSDIECFEKGCHKHIKQRLVEAKEKIRLCYKHWCKKEHGRGHMVNTTPRKKRILKNLPVKTFA